MSKIQHLFELPSHLQATYENALLTLDTPV